MRWGGLANDFTIARISSGVFSGSPFFACRQSFKTKDSFYIIIISNVYYPSSNTRVPTLRTKPGVSIIVRLGQCAYSALITIGLEETAVLVFFKSASVRDFMISAIADAKTTGLPYSSESSSCFQFSNLRWRQRAKHSEITTT